MKGFLLKASLGEYIQKSKEESISYTATHTSFAAAFSFRLTQACNGARFGVGLVTVQSGKNRVRIVVLIASPKLIVR